MSKLRSLTSKILNNIFRKIRFRLIASFMVPVAFIVLLGVLSFSKASEGITSSYEKSTTQALNTTGKYLEFGFESVQATSNQYINDDSIKKYFSGFYETSPIEKNAKLTEIKNSLSTKQTVDKFISDIYIISDISNPISTNNKVPEDIYQGFLASDFGINIMESELSNNWTGSDEYFDNVLDFGSEHYAMRLTRKIRKTNAVLVIDVSLEAVENVLRDLDFDETGLVGFITADGKEIIAESVSGEVEVNIANEPLFSESGFYLEAINGEAQEGLQLVEYNQEEYVFMYYRIGEIGATICGLVPRATIMNQAESIKNLTVIVALISIIVAIGIAIIISAGIDKSIKNIISNLKVAADGDLTADFRIKRKDEFMILTEELKYTFTNMKKLISQVKERSGEVSNSSTDVINIAKGFLSTSEEISFAINEIEAGIMQQAKDAEQCLRQMDNLSDKMLLVSESTKNIENIADNTKESVREGTVTTDDLIEQTEETTRVTSEIIKEIQNLGQKSSSISKVINVINDIADQTNLLSLNASIEAARAGEAGKGFAVVASEIRKLADESKDSVNNIKSIIDGIQTDTLNVVNIARETEDIIRKQEFAVKNTAKSFENINGNVEEFVAFLNEIVGYINNIEEARVGTLGAIESISAVLEEVAASSNTVNYSATGQLKAVEVLNKTAENLSGNADVLTEAVEKFKI
ncbi:MAG: methyl-accepting chemotaxis protein [Herbinix sp.]|nr:methyl-accepting chemotaxis protein [Herbinix sp.]